MRADLLALTPDDLAALTNRGTVKRAAREVASVELSEAEDGTVVATADDATVTLPAGAPLEDATCSCAAVGVCRHVVRAVLAYAASDVSEAAAVAVWNPGELTDEALAAELRPAALRRGRAHVARGLTATVVRSTKPMALLHDVEATVRFLVPFDLAYARCDCADQPPCEHVVPAVHAFRALDPALESGVIELASAGEAASPASVAPGEAAPRVPASGERSRRAYPPLDGVDSALALLAEAGLSGGGAAVGEALRRAEARCRDGGLPWPADICAELVDLAERHARADAAFDPLRVAQLAGEVILRVDALRAAAVPALFAGGPRSTPETEVGGGRLVGLGTRVRHVGRLVDVDALVYDTTAHRVLGLGRTFGDSVKSFSELAATSVQRSIPLAGVGAGQLIATGGRRSAGGRLRLGRRPAALSPQRYDWETHLHAPTLVEGVAEARGMRGASAPPPLAPRTAGANLAVIPLAELDAAGFHVPTQSVVAHVRDPLGADLVIAHPFEHRGAGGAERLLSALDGTSAPRFVAGEVRLRGAETVITPISVVVESSDGARRMLQPAVDQGDAATAQAFEAITGDTPPGEPAVAQHLHALQSALGGLLVTGAGRADRSVRDTWSDLADSADSHGSVLLGTTVRRLANALGARAHDTRWTAGDAVAAALALAATIELALAVS